MGVETRHSHVALVLGLGREAVGELGVQAGDQKGGVRAEGGAFGGKQGGGIHKAGQQSADPVELHRVEVAL